VSKSFANARDHLDAEIAVVSNLVKRQIMAHWELGILPRIKDEFSGTFVSGGEVAALMRGGNPQSEQGMEQIAEIDRQIGIQVNQIEEKLAAARSAGAPLPFDRLRMAFSLSPTEQRSLWVLIAIELDSRLRQLMRYLVNEANRVHADVGLLEILVYSAPTTREHLIRDLATDGRLHRHRLIESIGSRRQVAEAPYLLRPLHVSQRVLELVHGVVRLDREVAECATLIKNPPAMTTLIFPEELKKEVIGLVGGGKNTPVLVLSGAQGSGRKSLAMAAAASLGAWAITIDCNHLPRDSHELSRWARALIREAILFRAVPIFDNIDKLRPDPETGQGDRVQPVDSALTDFMGPVVATSGRSDTRPVALTRGIVVKDVPTPSEANRLVLWQRALADVHCDLNISSVAARYPIPGGIIFQSAHAAKAIASARVSDKDIDSQPADAVNLKITSSDIHVGLRSALDSKMSGLGRRVTWRQTWDDLVLAEDSMAEVHEFIARVHHRRRVYDEWGFSRKLAKGLGLSALFAGPPGTGKTMVAGLIADELSLDLYQIDLSRIVSKFVGETEKNLAELFDAAEAGHAILLFDEADSLFAKRTEVKSSVDRYANLEVNYLLQRMESFSGVTILTTNLDSSIDDAFRRRISFRINFPFPEPAERATLWRRMLPEEALVDDDIDFDKLANKYEMSGGYIRNAVLRAAFLAADESSAITMGLLLRAVNLEYTAMGKVISSL